MPFELKQHYTRKEINDVLGGNIQWYLPKVGGRVVCGCFEPEVVNPNAPEEVLFGRPDDAPIISELATLVFEQGQNGGEIPVFLKRRVNEWEYVGDFLCIGITRDPRVVSRKLAAHPSRRPFEGLLRFERVGP